MLIIGDLSGIQGYLFDVRETGGRQAASLRSRSFRLQVDAECLAHWFLWACGLGEEKLLVADAARIISHARSDSEQWLFDHAHGRPRFAIGAVADGSSIVDRCAELRRAMTHEEDHAATRVSFEVSRVAAKYSV
jgi:hypothetical protein